MRKWQPRVGNHGPPAQRRLWLVLGSSLFPSVPSKVIVDVANPIHAIVVVVVVVVLVVPVLVHALPLRIYNVLAYLSSNNPCSRTRYASRTTLFLALCPA